MYVVRVYFDLVSLSLSSFYHTLSCAQHFGFVLSLSLSCPRSISLSLASSLSVFVSVAFHFPIPLFSRSIFSYFALALSFIYLSCLFALPISLPLYPLYFSPVVIRCLIYKISFYTFSFYVLHILYFFLFNSL